MNDVNFWHISCSLRSYADDTAGYSSSYCPSILQTNVQNNLGLLVSWFHKNILAINYSKSQSIVFHRTTLPMPFVIDNNELDYVTQIKLLGVTIDNLLSFQAHIKEICQKVNAKISILCRIRKHIPPDISKGLSAKLESANAFALRTILNHSKLTAYEELQKMAHIKSLEHRRIDQALILVYKSIYDQAPIYIWEMFVLRNNGLSLQGHLKVVLPRPTSSYMQHSFMYQAGKQCASTFQSFQIIPLIFLSATFNIRIWHIFLQEGPRLPAKMSQTISLSIWAAKYFWQASTMLSKVISTNSNGTNSLGPILVYLYAVFQLLQNSSSAQLFHLSPLQIFVLVISLSSSFFDAT